MTKKKKNKPLVVSEEDDAQAQRVLEHYHQIASSLSANTSRKEAEVALSEINNLPEAAQMALLKALSKERHTHAANLLVAINELSLVKSIRKEAKRSLIQLEGTRIYPDWKLPVDQPPVPVVQLSTSLRRFWKGLVTDSRAVGEVQLLLCWEQGTGYRDVLVFGFLLDFWHDGVKDFFNRVESKQSFERFAAHMAQMYDMPLRSCSLAEGRRLLLDALAVNEQHGTVPHNDYRRNLALVNQLVLEAPGLEEDTELDEEADLDEEEDEESANLHDLTPQEVVMTFVESWVNGDYDTAYDLLASESPLREELSGDEWIERREEWADAANPGELEPNFIHEHESQKSGIWLPFGAGRVSDGKEIEAGWSIEMDETPLSDTLPELPKATAIYEETQRHWFWTTYILVQEQGAWRIQRMIDEGTDAQGLSGEELRQRVQELDGYLEEFRKTHKLADIEQFTEADTQYYAEEIFWRMMRAAGYTDALIKKMPLDCTLYEEASGRMIVFNQFERCLVYLEPLARRFEEKRGLYLRRLAEVQQRLGEKYLDVEDYERAERFQELAEEALNESLAVENNWEARISLAELFIDDDRFDEAEEQLLEAKAMTTDPADEAHIEMHLGQVATGREQYEEALGHYQRVAELQPDHADSWLDLAEAYDHLNNLEEAEAHYWRAIELEPDNEDLYYALSKMYSDNNQPEKAVEAIEDGLSAHPDSVILNIYLATMYLENGDYRQAEIFLERAEAIDPQSESVILLRQLLNISKRMAAPTRDKPRLIGPKLPNKRRKR